MNSASGARQRTALAELVTGFAAFAVLLVLLVVALTGRHRGGDEGYDLRATFNQIDGLGVGSDVRLAGITVGHVTAASVDPASFRARVVFTVRRDVKLPDDSAAIITSDSLLGGKYIALSPGGSEQSLTPGAAIVQTQGAISLEQLLSKFIFSVTDTLQKSKAAPAETPPSQGASSPAAGSQDGLPR